MEEKKNKQQNKKEKVYVVDTSVIIYKKISKLAKRGIIKGLILIPNAVIAELENLANKGQDVGFDGLEEIAKLHKIYGIKIKFIGPRPSEHQIRFAKSGEIDALIRGLAYQNNATLITADNVQAKSALAYNIRIFFIKSRKPKPKKKFLFWDKEKIPVIGKRI